MTMTTRVAWLTRLTIRSMPVCARVLKTGNGAVRIAVRRAGFPACRLSRHPARSFGDLEAKRHTPTRLEAALTGRQDACPTRFKGHAVFFFFFTPALILFKSSWNLSRTDFSSTEKSLNSA